MKEKLQYPNKGCNCPNWFTKDGKATLFVCWDCWCWGRKYNAKLAKQEGREEVLDEIYKQCNIGLVARDIQQKLDKKFGVKANDKELSGGV